MSDDISLYSLADTIYLLSTSADGRENMSKVFMFN